MNSRRYQLNLAIAMGVILILSSCKQPGKQTTTSGLSFKRISLPSRVFTIAGEAQAFEALGDANRSGEASISLRQTQLRFGKFDRASVYEYNKDGKVISRQEFKVDSDARVTIRATSGNRYLVYPDLGSRFRNTYTVACNLGRARPAAQIVPRICTQILCTDQPFPASQLMERVPELKTQLNPADLGGGIIGGFGRRGSICDQCLGQTQTSGPDFVPATGCSELVSSDLKPVPGTEPIIYTHQDKPTNADMHSQIFRTRSDAEGVINLSNNNNFETAPDVNHQSGRIVFFSLSSEDPGHKSGLTIMDSDGNNRALIPGPVLGFNPKWSRNSESFIIYITLAGNKNNSIHRVNPDGSGDVEVVHADPDKVIRNGDVLDDSHIVYSQDDGAGHTDIFIKDMRDSSAPANLTNTPDIAEDFPVISHDGTMIAFETTNFNNSQDNEIRVARLTLPSSISLLHAIKLVDPASQLFLQLDFSNDDTRIYVSAVLAATEGSVLREQLFSINLNGSNQAQVTVNDESDLEPSVSPR